MGCSAGPTIREVLQGAVEELADTRVDPHLPEMTSTELEKQGALLLPSNLSCVLGTLAQGPPETKMELYDPKCSGWGLGQEKRRV